MYAGILIVIVFLIMAFAMVTKRLSTLLALPLMAILIGFIAAFAKGLPRHTLEGASIFKFIFEVIITDGAVRLAPAMMYALFGAILSQVVLKTGIAERIIKLAAEMAGDKKILVAIFLVLATAAAFTALTGLGAVIMIGTLVLPILIGSGISPAFAGALLLFGISLGGVFNAAMWGFYVDALSLDLSIVKRFAVSYGIILALMTAVFLFIENFREGKRFRWAREEPKPLKSVPGLSLLTPILPVLLIILPWTKWPIIPAFIAACIYGVMMTNIKNSVPVLTASIIEGLKDMAPVIGLFIGIGMVLKSVMDPLTSSIMQPFIQAIIPQSTTGYLLFFTILAPLALYRGPLNLYGLGSGIAALFLGTGALPAVAIMGAFLATGQIQGICDPTNTHNVWIAQFTKTTPEDLLKKTILYVWVFVLLALMYSTFIGKVL